MGGHALDVPFAARGQGEAGRDRVRATRERAEHPPTIFGVDRLVQEHVVEIDDGVGHDEHVPALGGGGGQRGLELQPDHALDVVLRALAGLLRFVDRHRLDADAMAEQLEERAAAGRGGGEQDVERAHPR